MLETAERELKQQLYERDQRLNESERRQEVKSHDDDNELDSNMQEFLLNLFSLEL